MSGKRCSTRLQNELSGEELLAKRARRPPQNSLAAFDAKYPLAKMLKRGIRARKALSLPATRALVSLAIRRVQEDPIPISSSLAVSSSPSTLHLTPTKKKTTPHLPAFDLTSALNKPPYYISIFIVLVINGA